MVAIKVMRAFGSYALLLVCLGLGVGDVCAAGASEPLWAYGYLEPPLPSDKPPSQTPRPSTRELRPTQSPYEQTRLRRVKGSDATFSEVDIRDGGHVADWFPGDHPTMTRASEVEAGSSAGHRHRKNATPQESGLFSIAARRERSFKHGPDPDPPP